MGTSLGKAQALSSGRAQDGYRLDGLEAGQGQMQPHGARAVSTDGHQASLV